MAFVTSSNFDLRLQCERVYRNSALRIIKISRCGRNTSRYDWTVTDMCQPEITASRSEL